MGGYDFQLWFCGSMSNLGSKVLVRGGVFFPFFLLSFGIVLIFCNGLRLLLEKWALGPAPGSCNGIIRSLLGKFEQT